MRVSVYIKIIFLTFCISYCMGADKQEVCVQYEIKRQFGADWSKKYRVQGIIYKGNELNSKLNTYDFENWDSYLVIFWNQEEVSIIHLEDKYFYNETKGIDQRGISWKISNSYMCY